MYINRNKVDYPFYKYSASEAKALVFFCHKEKAGKSKKLRDSISKMWNVAFFFIMFVSWVGEFFFGISFVRHRLLHKKPKRLITRI